MIGDGRQWGGWIDQRLAENRKVADKPPLLSNMARKTVLTYFNIFPMSLVSDLYADHSVQSPTTISKLARVIE